MAPRAPAPRRSPNLLPPFLLGREIDLDLLDRDRLDRELDLDDREDERDLDRELLDLLEYDLENISIS